ncbi:TIR domain-containing protein [Pantoea dispersa]|uniref:TIR domain-containing protein n=1 Tax=Pantoea dispersa TaxID=59814 RepID=UPI000FD87D11|nr:molecular chaperone Tir [Pantoea dispersa]RVU78436.1 molecular chaperone Tir [Pantoea dispersa]
MVYRTKTYIAGEWDGDQDAIQQLKKWNSSNHWGLSFTDAHDLTQARDSSLNCSIKASLAIRFNASKRFVLVVGNNTKSARSGSCRYCASYNSWNESCARGYTVDHRSYIEYECDKAEKDGLDIIVLYNAATVDKSKCPDAIKKSGKHVAMCLYLDGKYYWDYAAVKLALS